MSVGRGAATGGHPQGPAPRFLICPDKFRGSLTAAEAASALDIGLHRGGAVETRLMPIADGGEGTIDCCLAVGYEARQYTVSGADGTARTARMAIRGGTAVIEAAEACGLTGRTPSARAAMTGSSRGVGELIRAALDLKVERIVVGVGGTACTDGGAGMLQALGATLRDQHAVPLRPGGAALSRLDHLGLDDIDPRLASCELVVATDVDNPLLGPSGAATVFGPQKGADGNAIAELERGLGRWAAALGPLSGRDHTETPGAGAGGGIGFGLLVIGALRVSGAETMLDLIGFDAHVRWADLVVTGEGSLDATSLRGKAPTVLAQRAHRHGVPVVAVAGRATITHVQARIARLDAVFQLLDLAADSEQSMRDVHRLLAETGGRILDWARDCGLMSAA